MKLGFIGTGNMASAIMGGIIKNQIIPANDIIGADVMEAGRERVKEQFKIQVTADNHEVINRSDIVILSVKPQFYAEIIAEIKDDVREDQIIITSAGVFGIVRTIFTFLPNCSFNHAKVLPGAIVIMI